MNHYLWLKQFYLALPLLEFQNKKYRGIFIEDVGQAVRIKNIQQNYNGKWTEIYKGKTYMFPKSSVLGIIK